MRNWSWIAIALLIACKGSSDDKAPPAPAKVAATVDAAPAVTKPTAKKTKQAKQTGAVAATPEEKANDKKFWAAMSKGRKATDAKDYDTAIAAFGDALATIPNNARALDERGYAEALAQKWDDAEKDLRKSLTLTKTPSLVGAGWYNLGLVAEGRGDLALARVAFANSNVVHPTKAAAAKLTGKSTCTAELSTPPAGKSFKTWMDLWNDFTNREDPNGDGAGGFLGCYDDERPAPKTDADVQAALCPSSGDAPGKCDGAGPWVVSYGDDLCGLSIGVVAKQADGTLLVFEDVGQGNGGHCASRDDVTIQPGGPLWIHVSRDVEEMVDVYVDDKDEVRDREDCEKDCDTLCDRFQCQEACYDDDDEEDDLLYDAKSGKPLLQVVQHGSVDVKLQGDGVFLKGGGCEEPEAFAK